MTRSSRRFLLAVPAALILLAPGARAQFSGRLEPAEAFFSGNPGDCFDEHKVADLLPPLPPTDVLLLVDLTGSMAEEREQLITYMEEIIDELPARVGDVAFGVAHHADYPVTLTSCGITTVYGVAPDEPYTLVQPVTTSRAAVLAAVASLPFANGGADLPESYSGALKRGLDDPAMAWRPTSRRLVMLFADDIPHDCDPGACLGLPVPSTGVDPGPDMLPGTTDDVAIMTLMDEMAAARVPLVVVESSGGFADPGRFEPDWIYWDCWARRTSGLAVSIEPDGTGTSGDTLADVIVGLLEDTLDRCPTVQLLAEPGYESWLVSATPIYYDVGAPARLEFDLTICIPPGAASGVHSFGVHLDCHGGTNARQTVTIDVGGCACAGPSLVEGTLEACYPDEESARVAALAATGVNNDCAGDPVIAAVVAGGCDAIVTVTSTHPCGNASVSYATRIDANAPVLAGLPPTQDASCDAVPAPPAVTADDACDGALSPAFDEVRIDGPCLDTYELRRTWTTADACGNDAAAQRSVNVADTLAPALLGVPADDTVECPLVPPPAVPTAHDNCDPDPMVAFRETRTDGPCPGRYDLLREWTATDRCGNETLEQQLVRVVDTTPPVIDPDVVTHHCLWPPRHRMVWFDRSDFAPVITDTCSEPVTWRIESCESSQPDDGRGDGHTLGDCAVSADGSAVGVRSERTGLDEAGRFVRVVAVAVDACGNESEPTVVGIVHIPHDQREHPSCTR